MTSKFAKFGLKCATDEAFGSSQKPNEAHNSLENLQKSAKSVREVKHAADSWRSEVNSFVFGCRERIL